MIVISWINSCLIKKLKNSSILLSPYNFQFDLKYIRYFKLWTSHKASSQSLEYQKTISLQRYRSYKLKFEAGVKFFLKLYYINTMRTTFINALIPNNNYLLISSLKVNQKKLLICNFSLFTCQWVSSAVWKAW